MELISATTKFSSVNVLNEVDVRAVMEQVLKDLSGREDTDDGFYVCDLGDVVNKHQRWLREFPRIQPFYAVKCNYELTVLKTLLALGTGFDCASKAEIRQMLAIGAKPEQIIYANPCKQMSHIRYARDNSIKLVVFDNEEELIKMKKNFPNARLILRMIADDSASVWHLSMKFGADIESCRGLIDKAQSMGLHMAGVCFHVGSGCRDVNSYVKSLKIARMLFDYSETVGYHFTVLDIGGGFSGTENVDLKFEEITSVVNQHLDKLFPEHDFPDLRVIAEPGTFYADSAFTLATNVIAKKKIYDVKPLTDKKNMGAYSTACASGFNGFKITKCYIATNDGRQGVKWSDILGKQRSLIEKEDIDEKTTLKKLALLSFENDSFMKEQRMFDHLQNSFKLIKQKSV